MSRSPQSVSAIMERLWGDEGAPPYVPLNHLSRPERRFSAAEQRQSAERLSTPRQRPRPPSSPPPGHQGPDVGNGGSRGKMVARSGSPRSARAVRSSTRTPSPSSWQHQPTARRPHSPSTPAPRTVSPRVSRRNHSNHNKQHLDVDVAFQPGVFLPEPRLPRTPSYNSLGAGAASSSPNMSPNLSPRSVLRKAGSPARERGLAVSFNGFAEVALIDDIDAALEALNEERHREKGKKKKMGKRKQVPASANAATATIAEETTKQQPPYENQKTQQKRAPDPLPTASPTVVSPSAERRGSRARRTLSAGNDTSGPVLPHTLPPLSTAMLNADSASTMTQGGDTATPSLRDRVLSQSRQRWEAMGLAFGSAGSPTGSLTTSESRERHLQQQYRQQQQLNADVKTNDNDDEAECDRYIRLLEASGLA